MGLLGSQLNDIFKTARGQYFFLLSFDEITGKILSLFEIIGRFTIEVSARISFKGELNIECYALFLQDLKLLHAVDHSWSLCFRDLSTCKILTLVHETNAELRPLIWSSPESPKSGDLFAIMASASPSIGAVWVPAGCVCGDPAPGNSPGHRPHSLPSTASSQVHQASEKGFCHQHAAGLLVKHTQCLTNL